MGPQSNGQTADGHRDRICHEEIMNRRDFITLPAATVLPSIAYSLQASGERFKKSICDGIIPRSVPLDEAFHQVKLAGFDGYEITMGLQLTLETPPSELKRIASAARDAGVTLVTISVSRPFSDCPLNHPDPTVRAQGVDVIKKSIDITHALNCGTVLLVPSRVGSGAKMMYRYEDTWKHTSAELSKVVSYAEQAEVVLTIENVWNKFLLSPLEMRAFVDQFKSPWLQAHFDTGNVMQFGYPQDWILTLGPRIIRVHLKDFNVQTNRFVPLMEGDANWQDVMNALVKVNYRGWLSPEYGHDPGDPKQINKLSAVVDKIYSLAG
jgi:L-ribulose-5-phosphate 3-epimerase